MTVTARYLVTEALHECGHTGIGQTPDAESTNRAFDRLNWMIDQWAVKRWLVYRLQTAKIVSTGATSYTVGTGGDITTTVDGTTITVRPDRLENGCFMRQLQTAGGLAVDYPLQLIESKEDYDRIGLKSLSAFSSYIFYNPAMPLGSVYTYPVMPATLYELHILMKYVLKEFPTLDTVIDLPPSYYAGLLYPLALRLCSVFAIPIPQTSPLPGLARDALATIRGSNTAIQRLQTPTELVRKGLYNIYSDRVY